MKHRFPRGGDERGTALLLAIALTSMLAILAAVAAMTARTEMLLAGRNHQARALSYAAEGAFARALEDLSVAANWTAALSGAPSSFAQGNPGGVTVPGGGVVVLCCGNASLSAGVQAAANGGGSWGGDTPRWQLYAWGPAAALLPPRGRHSPLFAAVWIADDPGDGDGDPNRDSNDVVALYSIALDPTGGRRGVRALVRRARGTDGKPLPTGVLLLSWHEAAVVK